MSGWASPGETVFIMGASGSGKTTLLNAISDRISRKRHVELKGEIFVNEKVKMDRHTFSKVGAYMM